MQRFSNQPQWVCIILRDVDPSIPAACGVRRRNFHRLGLLIDASEV